MITAPTYKDKIVGVFGLARTGIAAVDALAASGARVLAWDDTVERRDQVGSFAKDLYRADFTGMSALMLAPGVPLTHPKPHALVEKAKAAGVPLISDFDIFQAARESLPAHRTVAITGTNGKSTTTALIGHMVASCGLPVAIGGNIGRGVLSLDPLEEGGVYVLEMSSFQLGLTQNFQADVAILLNLTPDHLDRHGDMAGYTAAKKRLFDMQAKGAVAIVGQDDAATINMAEALAAPIVRIASTNEMPGGVYVADGKLVDDTGGDQKIVGDLTRLPTLKGAHNWQNAAAAYAAGRALGLAARDIFEAFKSFPGLAHRQELIGEVDGVRYVNDSKATNVDAASRALASYRSIRWIVGGRPKDKSFAGLLPFVGSVKTAYLLGEAADALVHDLGETIPYVDCRDMADAVQKAAADAEPGDVVLLSPACTAFDQFTDFEARGEAFRLAVHALMQGDAK
ncbi:MULTISPECIES: UDP-N-acetylmuramoyl-L-alanine--D-glutamate ligase [Kordiimonas]|uniref:UDP-N-acetylmuramoyl-L-alanine--D-glutamate ligase n=1 Tax=Kordiimonas TaxID=288021 RepID=UPI0025795A41|nr:UDP-N-acetylmuramoyl-L-alanine--D-glutamate ligase [Kordiimonas sp. UBA4487]